MWVRWASVSHVAALKGPRYICDRVEIRDVKLGDSVAIDVRARQLDGVAERLILITLSCTRADGLRPTHVDDADYAHGECSSLVVLCSLAV